MTDVLPAEAFPPGEFLRDELEERGWTQAEFAQIIRRPVRLVNEIIGNKRGISAETAIEIGAALGTSPQFWMNLDAAYRLHELRKTGPAPERIGREGRLREAFPVRELVRRGWVKESEDIAVLESRVLRFYKVGSVEEKPAFACAARQWQTGSGALSPLQEAWLCRVKQIAEAIHVIPYSSQKLREALAQLAAYRSAPEEARHVPKLLAECGVRLVIVEPMPGSKIDGVCLWLSDDMPVIGMTLLLDRIDNFWFVLRHEIEHVLRGDGKSAAIVDTDLSADVQDQDLPPEELEANRAAAQFCVSQDELNNFLARVGTAVAEERIVFFADRLGIHPGLVVGQIQRRLGRYNFLRKYLVRVRDIVTPNAMTDGYGRQLLEALE